MKTSLSLLPLAVLLNLAIAEKIAYAQAYRPSNRVPIADTTLGTQVSGNNSNFTITGGINRGQNLFHSFQDFSVPTNGTATFVNPAGNQSIITRVTGRSFSDINGTINTQGANFLLINPNGVVFGPNTTLNVGRVFAASTANSLDLVDGTGKTVTFGTNTAGDAPLLTVKPGVLFSASRLNMGGGSGAIRNFGNLQTNNPNQYIGLVGGNISLDGGQINAPGGRVELGGLSAPGLIGLGTDRNNPRLSFPVGVARSDVSMNNQSRVNAEIGNIAITAKNINLSKGSSIDGNINIHAGGLTLQNGSSISLGNFNPEGMKNAGKIDIQVDGAIRIIGSSIDGRGDGNGGDININSHSFSLTNGASIISGIVQGRGNGGIISIRTGDLSLHNNSHISSGNFTEGNGGDMNIHARELTLQESSSISSDNFFPGGIGNAGKINIHVNGAIRIIGSSINGRGEGNGGDININSHSFLLTNGASVVSDIVQGRGTGGSISIRTGDLSLQNSSSISSGNAEGNGGDVNIHARELTLQNGSSISSGNTSLGSMGNAGKINIQVDGAFRIIGSLIDGRGDGNGGDININSHSFLLTNGASIVSALIHERGNGGSISIRTGDLSLQSSSSISLGNSGGIGNTGEINMQVNGAIRIIGGSSINNSINEGAEGNGGDINISSRSLLLADNASVSVANNGLGNAGNITIRVLDSISINGGNGLNSQASSGNGGNIKIDVNSLILRHMAKVSTNAFGTSQQSNGGDIAIKSKLLIAIPQEDSDITATAVGGQGGNVTIDALGIFGIQFRNQITNRSDITASSKFSSTAPSIDPIKDTNDLTAVPINDNVQISQSCMQGQLDNKFYITGRGGHPASTNEPLTSDVVWTHNNSHIGTGQTIANNISTQPQPAEGWVANGQGKISLVATNGRAAFSTVQSVCSQPTKNFRSP